MHEELYSICTISISYWSKVFFLYRIVLQAFLTQVIYRPSGPPDINVNSFLCLNLVLAAVPNSRINSWESWFIFNLRKKKQSVRKDSEYKH